VASISNLSVRAKTLPELWNSTEPSFAAIRKATTPELTKKLLLLEINKMVELLKADMQAPQLLLIVNYILQHYYSYTISDITYLTQRLARCKPYGRPMLQDIIYELDQYSIERNEFATQQRIAENSKHKSETIANDKILRIYNRMKHDARQPVLTQKEKDQAAMQRNAEKVKELQMLYPNK